MEFNLDPKPTVFSIWAGVRREDNLRTSNKLGNYRFHEIDFFIKLVDQLIEGKQTKQKAIEDYEYPYQIEKDIATKIFFDQMIQNPNWFHVLIPGNSDEHQEGPVIMPSRFLQDLFGQHTHPNLWSEDIDYVTKHATWFAYSMYGLLVNFDATDSNPWLFTDEVSAYWYVSNHQDKSQDEEIMDEEWYSSGYRSYNLAPFKLPGYLLELAQKLVDAKIPQHLSIPDDAL